MEIARRRTKEASPDSGQHGIAQVRFIHGMAPGRMPPRKRLPITRSAPSRIW
jgi:hypothetical protein